MKGCRNCSCWQALEEFLDRIDPATQDKKAQLGLCKRYAPRPLTPEGGAGETVLGDLPEQISSIFAGLLPEDCLAAA